LETLNAISQKLENASYPVIASNHSIVHCRNSQHWQSIPLYIQ